MTCHVIVEDLGVRYIFKIQNHGTSVSAMEILLKLDLG